MTNETQPKSVSDLLKAFKTRTQCARFGAPTAEIELLTNYIWVRQFERSLTVESFLDTEAEMFEAAVGTGVHPMDILKRHCPRVAKAAEAAEKEQWTAVECAGVLALYVDMLREAEAQVVGSSSALVFADFLAAEADAFKAGEYEETVEIEGEPASVAPDAPEPGTFPRLSTPPQIAAGTRVIYTIANTSRQLRGHVSRANTIDDRTYLDFESDDGELYAGCSVQQFELCEDPAPAVSTKARQAATITVPASIYATVEAALDSEAQGCDTIHRSSTIFDDGYVADVDVSEGARGAYVSAALYASVPEGETAFEDVRPIVELPPREVLLGTYIFEAPECEYVLTVVVASEE